jgi:cytochrome c oxidase cbb3-type subunit I/II
MLIAPSWGGMVNGLLTLRGAWDKVREDPVLKFMVVGVTAYGMSTFEGPMMSLKNVNALTHYTDYIIGHVHLGALAWNGGLAFGILYYIVPRIYRTQLHSIKMANFHFWAATMGILFYAIPMYIGGITQSMMWKEFLPDGTLRYTNFLETVTQIIPMYMLRAIGGTIYIIGAIAACINLWKTAKSGSLLRNEEVEAPALVSDTQQTHKHWHRVLEGKPLRFALLSLVAILIGGIVEYVPTALIKSNIPTIASVKPYTPLEIEGRDIYIREGCVGCHSQMIRPFRSETERYGEYSKAGEFVYDHPFLWGSKRTGPDLHRVGGKYPNAWHYMHMQEPQTLSPGSIMPAYPWLYTEEIKFYGLEGKIITLRKLGVPYPEGFEKEAAKNAEQQAELIVADLKKSKIDISKNKEIIAMIAYLQRLGTDIKAIPSKK